MTDFDYEKLADLVVEKLKAEKNGKRDVPPVLIRRRDISAMLGNAAKSSATDKVLNDPTFPPAISVVDGVGARWRYADVKTWIDRHFDLQRKMMMQAIHN